MAYGQPARLMTGVEADLYEKAIAVEGGRSGWRPCLVREKVKESGEGTGEYYRISVKRESGVNIRPSGMISHHLHRHIHEGDVVEMASPAGEFILDISTGKPVVLISGGVGQTPLVSMAEYLINTGRNRDITWIHGVMEWWT